MAAGILVSCIQNADDTKDHSSMNEEMELNEHQVDRFADIQVLRYMYVFNYNRA